MKTVRTLWGQRIRTARQAVGMTQVQLAGALKVTQQLVSAWEHGLMAPRDDRRAAVARVLGVPVDQLFAYPDPPNGDEVAA